VQSAKAQSYGLLYSFESSPDGSVPASNLVLNGGYAYGTTTAGGNDSLGTIFKVNGTGKETVVHNFSGAPDGQKPSGALARDSSGNVYGTTYYGGTCGEAPGCGTVFKLTTTGTESIVYSFPFETGDADYPASGVTIDTAGNLYGAANGGAYNKGSIFKIDTKTGEESVLYSFGGSLTDGQQPFGALILDTQGNLYGATQGGGACTSTPGGTIFKVDPAGTETVLYSFCLFATTGSSPSGPLVYKGGNLYGVAGIGGDLSCPAGFGSGCGTVFELSSSGTLTVLHAFAGGASDGAISQDEEVGGGWGLVHDSSGNLYGATQYGGNASTAGDGTVYEVAGGKASGYQVLHVFTGGNTDGANPISQPSFLAGAVYGTTSSGGVSNNGAVYKLKP
jgi:uncharacterized repeat protein (TIGR03803 family)